MRAAVCAVLTTSLLALAACGTGAPEKSAGQSTVRSVANAVGTPSPAATPSAQASGPGSATEEHPDFDFTYSYPAAAAKIPALDAWLQKDRTAARTDLTRDVVEAKAEAERDDIPYRRFDSTTKWEVVTETPRLLSLSAEVYRFTGGAHGNTSFRSLIWDKSSAIRLEPIALFQPGSLLQAAVKDAFCRQLNTERARRRGGDLGAPDGPFTECPAVNESTLILGSTTGQAIDRVGFLIPPYVAGAYAEGSYEITLPVTRAVLDAVRPSYRDAFALAR